MGWLTGWQNAATHCEGLRRAIGEVGYENLNGEAVAEGIFSIKDWREAMTGAPISFGDYPDDRIAQEEYRMWQYDTASKWWVPITDWMKAPSFADLSKYVK